MKGIMVDDSGLNPPSVEIPAEKNGALVKGERI